MTWYYINYYDDKVGEKNCFKKVAAATAILSQIRTEHGFDLYRIYSHEISKSVVS